jgi:hypothetical protein
MKKQDFHNKQQHVAISFAITGYNASEGKLMALSIYSIG